MLEIPLGTAVAVVVSVVLQGAVDRLRMPLSPTVTLVALALSGAAMATVAVVLACTRLRTMLVISWVTLSSLGTLPLAIPLHGSRFYLNGLSGDQSFRSQYLTRFAQSPALADMNYADTPPFYPAGWFWVGGRLAALCGFPGWAVYKPFALATMAVAPVIAFALWSTVLRRRLAFACAVATCLIGVRIDGYEPYSWLLAASLPPIAVIAGTALCRATRGARRWASTVLIGGFLGACGAVYTLLFVFSGFVLTGFACVSVVANRRAGPTKVLAAAVKAARELIVIGIVAVPAVLAVWAPFLVRALHGGGSDAGALRFLPEQGAMFPMPMLDASVSGAICLLGVAWIVAAWRASQVARGLGWLVVFCYLWYLLSFLALAGRTTLLPFRLEPVLVAALSCAGICAAWEVFSLMARRIPEYSVVARVLGAVLAALCVVDLVQTVQKAEKTAIGTDVFTVAMHEHDDTGAAATGPSDRSDDGWWTGRVIDAVRRLSGRPPQDLVMLTSQTQLLAFQPYHGFQISDRAYANPLARYDQRRMLIASWARSGDADELVHALDRSPFAPPTVFVLTRGAGDEFRLQLSKDSFPAEKTWYEVSFSGRLFDNRYFVRDDVGPYVVLVRR
jgi:galactan 5-O-arabinofuranosyltransferase